MRLWAKICILVVLVFASIGLAMGYVAVSLSAASAREEYERNADSIATMIQYRIEHEMVESSWNHLNSVLEGVVRAPGINSITLYDHNGVIVASGRAEEIGQNRNDAAISTAVKEGFVIHRAQVKYGVSELGVIRPLANKPKCFGCHGSGRGSLGAVEVGLDRKPLDDSIRREFLILLGTGFATLVCVGVVLTLALRRMVLDRLERLAGAARRMSHGDYTLGALPAGKDEVGVVTAAFNDMAQAVDSAARELEDKVQQRTRELVGLVQVVTSMNRFLDVDKVLEEGLKAVLEATGGDAACILESAPDKRTLTLRASTGFVGDEITRVTNRDDVSLQAGIDGGRFPNQVNARLMHRDSVWGWIVVLRRGGEAFPPGTGRFLNNLAEPLGAAIEKGRLHAEVRERDELRGQLLKKLVTAQEEERKRIAREIHDEWGQKLSVIIASIAQARTELPGTSTEMAQKLDLASDMARQAIKDMRQLISELRPEMLDDLGLLPTLKHHFRERLEPLGISVTLVHKGMQRRLPVNVELPLFRVIQETLSNVARHSGATTAEVRLERVDSSVQVVIQDNGRGFDVDHIKDEGTGWGLKGMDERVWQMGGKISIESVPGIGTTVRIEIPLKERDSDVKGQGVNR